MNFIKKKRPSLCDGSFSEESPCDGGDVGKADGSLRFLRSVWTLLVSF